VSTETRLAQLLTILEQAGLECLVMGGHAVRFYGVGRNTVDFDFYASAPSMQDVREALAKAEASGILAVREGPSWRPADFARFEIGRLPDGREEWLEFWLRNHLLPNFFELWSRRECGAYGGGEIAFLSLPDLIRSKETEREGDWADVSLLEEILDARHLAQAAINGDTLTLLSSMTSRRGFERALKLGLMADQEAVRLATQKCEHPVSFAFLLPFARDSPQPASLRFKIDEAFLGPLRTAEPGVSKHIALVEVVRRAYKRWAMEVDRRDKLSQSRPGLGG
jgi:hypothetical protein